VAVVAFAGTHRRRWWSETIVVVREHSRRGKHWGPACTQTNVYGQDFRNNDRTVFKGANR